jgi:serine/threonine-protein kinase HipA
MPKPMSLKDKMEVFFQEQTVGFIFHNIQERAYQFIYDNAFIQSGIELSPFVMPLHERPYEFPQLAKDIYRGLPPLFCDSFPDSFGSKVYHEFLKHSDIPRHLDPFFYLTYLGQRGAGALSYSPQKLFNQDYEKLDIHKLALMAQKVTDHKQNKVLSLENKDRKDLEILAQLGASTGGARPKVLIAREANNPHIYAGDIIHHQPMSYELLKLSFEKVSQSEIDYGKMEYAYYLMARDLGINISKSYLYEDKHFCTQRFDRDENGNRFHYQTFNSFFGLNYKDKNSGIGYENFFRALTKLKLPPADLRQFYKQMCFNVIAMNRDDHLKNFALILKDNQWRLAPAYDLVYCSEPGQMLHVNGKYMGIQRKDLETLGENYFIKDYDLIIDNTLKVVSQFKDYCQAADLNKANSIFKPIYEDLMTELDSFESPYSKIR